MDILEVKSLSKAFGGVAALKDVSFDVPEGQIRGFIGPNGAGKTTLFSLIAGAVRPSAGNVALRGGNITGKKPSALVKMGVVRTHQIVRPFRALSVLENVQLAVHFGRHAVASPTVAKERAMDALKLVGLDGKAKMLASALSLGEQKRLEVARALATAPSILVMSVCDKITVLNFGQKLAEGKPEEIQNNDSVIEAYLGKPTLRTHTSG